MSDKTGWVEKRQFERIVATLKVDYRLVDSKDSKKTLEHTHYKLTRAEHLPELSKKSPLYHAVTKDISLGGLSLLGQDPFEMGGVVEIGLHLPKYKTTLKFWPKWFGLSLLSRWEERSTALASRRWPSIGGIWTVSKNI